MYLYIKKKTNEIFSFFCFLIYFCVCVSHFIKPVLLRWAYINVKICNAVFPIIIIIIFVFRFYIYSFSYKKKKRWKKNLKWKLKLLFSRSFFVWCKLMKNIEYALWMMFENIRKCFIFSPISRHHIFSFG